MYITWNTFEVADKVIMQKRFFKFLQALVARHEVSCIPNFG